jgi:hypothetical protein
MPVESVVKACLWIGSRDEAKVASLREDWPFIALAIETRLAWDDIDPEALPPLPGWVELAQRELLDACVRGDIKLIGIPSSGGASEVIPAAACAMARFFWHDQSECLGPPGSPPGQYWTHVKAVVDDVRRVWPARQTGTQNATHGSDGREEALPSETSRTPGSGNTAYNDEGLVERAISGMKEGKYKSARAAARALSAQIAGHGAAESKERRLADKIRARLKSN